MCITKGSLPKHLLKHVFGKEHNNLSRLSHSLYGFGYRPEMYGKHEHFVRFKTSKSYGEDNVPVFAPRRVTVLTKMTRFQYERRRHRLMSDKEFRAYLESKDSDYDRLLQRHRNHLAGLEAIRKAFEAAGIEARIVERFQLTSSMLDWADAVFTAGGDGTYLLAASKFVDNDKPLIGLNTDPERSEGHLCLPKRKYPAVNFAAALRRMLSGDFRWRWLQRIKVTMSGQHSNDTPVELHDQQLSFPEHRFTEHVAEREQERHPVNITSNPPPVRVLPVFALNEVFIGESLSSRVSYYEFSADDGPGEKQKSSGITICTGTGSSSWHFHINHLSVAAVRDVLTIANKKTGSQFPADDWHILESIAKEFNDSLRFSPSSPRMAYTIRDPVVNRVFQVSNPRNFATKIRIRSRMWDACLVIDGGISFKFNDGAVAALEIAKDQAIRTVTFD